MIHVLVDAVFVRLFDCLVECLIDGWIDSLIG